MNRLASATSPYLRQHADNPVDWWPWIPEAFEEAKRRNVPVHLSIGYSACHWCHVMAEESFSNPEIAAALNRDFVSIKVDREERPEVDQIYMRALHALGEKGGWPLTMFLTPDAVPFWGGTYFPPEPRFGRPGFPQLLAGIAAAWKAGDSTIRHNAATLQEHLNRPVAPSAEAPTSTLLDGAASTLSSVWDHKLGSFQGAPKFPNAAVVEVLWRAWLRTGNTTYREAVLTTLSAICQGGIYDHLAGGFARYAVDAEWKVPHFEKMLYDNSLLLSLLSFGYRETRNPLFRARIDETVAWLVREMQLPGGAFAASLDADTEHEEGLTYVWTWDELQRILGDSLPVFAEIYDALPGGNWEGKIVLNRMAPDSLGWLGDKREGDLEQLRRKLLKHRDQRPQPARDDKILADWNGLAISGLVHAAHATASDQAKAAARHAFDFVLTSMTDGDRLAHSCLDGEHVVPGIATDYANMIRAALDLFTLDGDTRYLDHARAWFTAAKRHHFASESVAYLLAADDTPNLIAQTPSLSDEATPAATGVIAENAARLFMLTADSAYQDHAQALLGHLTARADRDIVGVASLQSACDTILRGRLAFVVGAGPEAALLRRAVLAEPDPALTVVSARSAEVPADHPAHAKRPTGKAAVFLCDAFRCLPELPTPDAVTEALQQTRPGLA